MLSGAAAAAAVAASRQPAGRAAATGPAGWAGFSLTYTWAVTAPREGALCGMGEPLGAAGGALTALLAGAGGFFATASPGASRRVVGISSAGLVILLAGVRLQHGW